MKSRTWAFQKTRYGTPKIQDGGSPPFWRQNAKRWFSQKLSNQKYGLCWRSIGSRIHGLFKEPITGPLKSKMAEIRHLGCWRQNANSRFSGKLSKLVSCNWTFQRNHYWSPKIQDGWGPLSWKSTSFFLCRVWSDLDKISVTGAEWHVDCGDIEIETSGGRFGKFNGMSSQSHLPYCRVLPPGEFNVMIPELRVTLQGAATGRIQWHVIPSHVSHCHLVNSLLRFQSHMPHCRVQSPGEINVMIVPHCRV